MPLRLGFRPKAGLEFNQSGNPLACSLRFLTLLSRKWRNFRIQRGLRGQTFENLSPNPSNGATVTRIDAHFGNLLDALEDPNGDGDKADSVAHETLVVFQSDNGGPRGSNREELNANGGLQGSKGSIYEGGIRVPTIIRWPAKITGDSKLKVGSSTDLIVDCSDWLPTFCELAGYPVPLGLSGVSLAPTLTGKGDQRVRDFLIHEAGGQASIVRGRYKLIRSRANTKAAKPGSNNKKRAKKPASGKNTNNVQLYDLQADPAERNNLASVHPQLVKELNALLTGERVDEAAGFANTYHTWKGPQEGAVEKAANWTDYVYQNAGETYQKETGPPQSHWCARIDRGSAIATRNTKFLGLEISSRLTVNPSYGPCPKRIADHAPRTTHSSGRDRIHEVVDAQSGGTLPARDREGSFLQRHLGPEFGQALGRDGRQAFRNQLADSVKVKTKTQPSSKQNQSPAVSPTGRCLPAKATPFLTPRPRSPLRPTDSTTCSTH